MALLRDIDQLGKHDFLFELRALGVVKNGTVGELRKCLRNVMHEGKTPDAKYLEGLDISNECRECDLISDILDVDLANIGESQCRTDHQRFTARCRAFEGRLKLLESWAESSGDVNSRKHILSIGEKVKRVLADSETCPVAENEVSPQESAPPGGSRSDAGPLIQF